MRSKWFLVFGLLSIPYIAVAANNKINGACGPANYIAVATKPTSGLCNVGSPSIVTGLGPWKWSCKGTRGGSTASCSAPVLPSNPILILQVIPTNPIINSIVPLGTVVAKVNVTWSNGDSFIGRVNFIPPYNNDNDFFTLIDNNIVTNNDISMLGGTTQFVTLQAIQ